MIALLENCHVPLIVVLEKTLFDHSWDAKQIQEHLDSNNPIWGEIEDDVLCGVLTVSEVAGEWEIYRIAVDPQFRRQGIAKRLMSQLDKSCSSGDKIFLEVRADNIPAQALYRSFGYSECGLRKKYYSDGEDAVLMMKTF